MPAELDAVRMAAWRAFLTAHRRLTDRLAADLDAAGELPLSWYDVLVNLEEAEDDRLRMTELSDRVLLSASGLTRLVDRMAAGGLVTREQCPTDRRGTFVVLTAEGRDVLQAAAPVHLDGIARHFAAHVDPEEAAVLRDVFQRIADAVPPSTRR